MKTETKKPNNNVHPILQQVILILIGLISVLDLWILFSSAINEYNAIGITPGCTEHGDYVTYQNSGSYLHLTIYIFLIITLILLLLGLHKFTRLRYKIIVLITLIVVGAGVIGATIVQGLAGIQCIPF